MSIQLENKKNAEEILELGAILETKVAELYSIFAQKFADDDLVRDVFLILVMEEKNHASFLRSKKEILNTVSHVFGDTLVDVSIFMDAQAQLGSFLAKAKSGDFDLAWALQVAYAIEDMVVEKEYFGFIEVSASGLKKTLDSLLLDSEEHRSKIKSLAEVRGVELTEASVSSLV